MKIRLIQTGPKYYCNTHIAIMQFSVNNIYRNLFHLFNKVKFNNKILAGTIKIFLWFGFAS